MARSRAATTLLQLLDAASVPVYVVDDRRRIAYCNPACAAWVGVEADVLCGAVCAYHGGAADAVDAAAAGLCPPPQAFAGRGGEGVVAAPAPEGGWRERTAWFAPLGEETAACPGVLVVVGPEAPPAPDDVLEADGEQLHRLVRAFRAETAREFQIHQLAGASPAMRRVREQVKVAAEQAVRVLIQGPCGSGRERVARTIYYRRAQSRAGPLTPLSCSLLDAELLEATVTAFLRQCAELELEAPAALLLLDVDQLQPDAQHVLAEIVRVPEFGVQTLATAEADLAGLAAEGRFHTELAYALSTLIIQLPPLSARKEDIPLLAQMALEQWNAQGGEQRSGFAPEALDVLQAYCWPGNVDELVETVEAACAAAESPWVGVADLPPHIRGVERAGRQRRRPDEAIRLDEFLEQVERELIERALRRARGNKAKAARLLGISRPRLLRRAARLGLLDDPPVVRPRGGP